MSIPNRLLALDLRARRFGFAVLENQSKLLDWGVRSFGEDGENFKSTLSDRINTLIGFYEPFAAVTRLRKYHSSVSKKRFAAVLASVRSESRRNSIRLFVITTHQVQRRFAENGQATKHEIATSLAKQFEELSWKLPLRRKSYQSEAPILTVFDAVANGIVFLESQTRSTPNVGAEP